MAATTKSQRQAHAKRASEQVQERREQTELMVLITPRLVRALDPDEVPPLPTMQRRFIGPDIGKGLEGGGGTVDAPKPGTKR